MQGTSANVPCRDDIDAAFVNMKNGGAKSKTMNICRVQRAKGGKIVSARECIISRCHWFSTKSHKRLELFRFIEFVSFYRSHAAEIDSNSAVEESGCSQIDLSKFEQITSSARDVHSVCSYKEKSLVRCSVKGDVTVD